MSVDTDATAVAARGNFSVARTRSGTVYVWGNNAIGDSATARPHRTTPVPVPGLLNVIRIAAGQHHSLALTAGRDGVGLGPQHTGAICSCGTLEFEHRRRRCRHTFCSHLATKGAPARAIQELAGHRDLTTTQRYMHLSPSAVVEAIRLLDGTRNFRDMLETADR